MADIIDVVQRAQHGDRQAFATLLDDFQGLVLGLAMSRLGRLERAQDVSQEVFLEMFQTLSRLREPRAFPLWLKRLVIKHCDRLTRRRRVSALDPATPVTDGAVGDDPAEARDPALPHLLDAIATLAPAQRLAIVLHYLCHRPIAEIAEICGATEGAIKKRLADGRQRCAEGIRTLMDQRHVRRDPLPGVAPAVQFFIAVRDGDLETVATLLQLHPHLVHAHEQWDLEATRAHGLPDASGQTALIRAVQNGDDAMTDLLLAHGARPQAMCTCVNGEQSVHTAVLAGRLDLLERLVAAGARLDGLSFRGFSVLHVAVIHHKLDLLIWLLGHGAPVEATDGAGRTALHWAAIAGDEHAVAALLAAGAQREALDVAGRTPAVWAERRGFGALAAHLAGGGPLGPAADPRGDAGACTFLPGVLDGRRFAADGSSRDGGGTLAHTLRPAPRLAVHGAASAGSRACRFWETGITAIDLFAPIPRTSRILLQGGPGVGKLVLVAEICARLRLRHDVDVLLIGWESTPAAYSDIVGELVEVGIAGHVGCLWQTLQDPPAAADGLLDQVRLVISTLCRRGREVLLVVMDHRGHDGEMRTLLGLAGAHGHGGVGVLIVHDLTPHTVIASQTMDATIMLEPALGALGCYPAVDPTRSWSRLQEGATALPGMPNVRQVRSDLAALRDQPTWPRLPPDLDLTRRRALACQWSLSQSFGVTQLISGLPGESVGSDDALALMARIRAGEFDAQDPGMFRYLPAGWRGAGDTTVKPSGAAMATA